MDLIQLPIGPEITTIQRLGKLLVMNALGIGNPAQVELALEVRDWEIYAAPGIQFLCFAEYLDYHYQ